MTEPAPPRTLSDRVALVTGANAGLGLAIARSLAAEGADLVINGICPLPEGTAVAKAIRDDFGVAARFDPTDLSDPDAIETMIATIGNASGGVDILVNNAVVRHFAPIRDFTRGDWDTSIAVNLSAAFHLIRLCLPHMQRQDWGRIVNISSIYGSRAAANRIDYVTTKTALIGLTRACALELARTGITCNAVCPGTVDTDVILSRIEAIASRQGISVEQAQADYLEPRNPSGRFVDAASVGALVVYLCGPHARDITGTNLPVDGGWLAS